MSESPARTDGPIRILVVDADDRVRESLTALLAIGDRVLVVGSSGEAGSALDLAISFRPDVVVVDPRLPEVDSGLNLIAMLRAQCPEVRILALSSSDALERAVLAGGAHRCVRKTFRPAELIAAVFATGDAASA